MGCHDLRVVALLVLRRFILESEKKTETLSATVMNEPMIGNWDLGKWVVPITTIRVGLRHEHK